MDTGVNWFELGSAIIAGAGVIAGALKLLARDIGKSISKHGEKIEANTAAIDRNTEAQANDRPGTASRVALLLALFLALFALAGCAATDPLLVRALERNREVWQEEIGRAHV